MTKQAKPLKIGDRVTITSSTALFPNGRVHGFSPTLTRGTFVEVNVAAPRHVPLIRKYRESQLVRG